MDVQDLKRRFSSPNYSNNGEVQICPAAQTLFNVQPIYRVLEVQMTSIFFPTKLRQFSRMFMVKSIQILMLSMTFCSDKKIKIVTKSRCGHSLNKQSSNQQFQILPYKRRHLPCIQVSWLFRSRSCSLFLSLYFAMFKFYFMLYFFNLLFMLFISFSILMFLCCLFMFIFSIMFS